MPMMRMPKARRALGDAAREVAGADGEQGLAREFLTAIAHPAMGALFSVEMSQAADVEQQRHEDELGEGPGVNAARGGDENVAIEQAEAVRGGADAAAGGLDPAQPLCLRDVGRRGGQVPEDFGAGERLVPAALLIGVARERCAVVVGGVAGGREQVEAGNRCPGGGDRRRGCARRVAARAGWR